jgi:glycosyltransferase involved in cell wall biosynthesis
MLRINYAGRWEKNEGYGNFTYNFFDQLGKLPIDIAPIHLEQLNDWQIRHFRAAGYDPNRPLLLIHPPDLRYVTKLPGRMWCFTMYEATALPENWVHNINQFCERLLVPNQFCVDVFERQGIEKPIHIIPGGIDPTMPIYAKEIDRPFTFLCLADRGNRKGHDLVWRAFYDVFGMSDNVRLITKMRQDPEGLVNYLREDGSDYRISLYKSDVPEVADIYASVDCLVFPTRGEGWGLPPREAAACGVPTICTSWGATEDIDNWGIGIGYKLEKSLLPGNGLWAEPNFEDLKNAMRMCYEMRGAVKHRAIEHAHWLRENQTWAHAANKLYSLMQEKLT